MTILFVPYTADLLLMIESHEFSSHMKVKDGVTHVYSSCQPRLSISQSIRGLGVA